MTSSDRPARLPDILCIGAQKAGTSWLHQIFGGRSDIWLPPFKEQHFFDHMFIEKHRDWIGPHLKRGYDSARERFEVLAPEKRTEKLAHLNSIEGQPYGTLDWYRSVFAPAPVDQMAMDVTPEYSGLPQEGLDYIKDLLPGVKLIYIIRDPMERMKSQVRMNVGRRLMQNPPKEIIWRWEGRNPVVHNRGNYAEYIPRWDATFGRDQLLFLPFGLIRENPERLLRMVEQFLGLPPGKYQGMDRRVHRSGKRDLPEETLEQLRIGAEPQEAFLKSYFDKEFLSLIK
ncbi:sulfotransferase family protein [Halovulum sp. GXIMD14793]